MAEFFSSIPLYYAKIITAGLYLLLALWVFRRPRSYIFREAPTQSRWRDLRIWALVLIGIQIILYIVF